MHYTIHELTYSEGTLSKNKPSELTQTRERVAIVVHIFYIDIWEEILTYLQQLTISYDLYITVPEGLKEKDIIDIFHAMPNAHLYMVENRGRDVLPFLQILNIIGTHNYEYICKLHTKKSVTSDSGNAWRKLLYYDLIGSADIVDTILSTFDKDPNIGIVTGKNLILNAVKFDLGNSDSVKILAEQAKIPYIPNYHFAAGTMFWVRTSVLTPLLPLIESDRLIFEDEAGQSDHTLAHALERFFGLLCEDAGLRLAESHADYRKLDKQTLEELAVLAFTQRFKYEREIAYRDKRIQERDQKILAILSSTSYKLTFPLRKLPFITQTLLHFDRKKIHIPDSNEFRFTQAIQRRVPKKIISLLKRIRRRIRKRRQTKMPWHLPLSSASQHKGRTILIIAELSIPQCTKYRVEQKVEMLKILGYKAEVVSWTDFYEARTLLQLSGLVFFYRVPAYPLVISLINESKRLSIPSFFDVDDLIFDKTLLAQNCNLQNLPKKSQNALLKGADLYQQALSLTSHSTASTQILSDAMQKYNHGQSYLIPNCLDQELLTYIHPSNDPKRSDNHTIKIVYGSGTSTHDIDFLEVSDALLHILRTYDNVAFIVHGTLTLPSEFDSFSPKITQIPFMPIKEYYTQLQTYDINIAPLEKTLFNDAKSNIKYLEASIFKLPTIASNVSEYTAVIKEGENGFLAKNTQEWIVALKKLIDDANLRNSIGENAYQTVLETYQLKTIAHNHMLPLVQKHMFHQPSHVKHILMANVLYNPISFGGATIVIEELSKRIKKKDAYDVTVFTGFFDENYDLPRPYDIVRYEINEVPIILVRFPFPMTQELEYRNEEMEKVFDKIVSSLEPDLVHFHSIQQLSASIVLPCQQRQIPYVITLHDMWWLCEKQFMIKPDNTYCYQNAIETDYCITQCTHNADQTKARTAYLKPLLEGASLLLAPSSFQAQMYAYNISKSVQIEVNKNAILFPSSDYTKKRNKTIRFAYLGGKATHKGYDFIKEVFATLHVDNYELVMVDLHRKLGHHSILQDTWNIDGKLILSDGYSYTQKGLDTFFETIDVLLFPSQWKESFGLTVREALVRDVWVISTDAGGVTEDIVEGENGNIVPIGDIKGFRHHILWAIENFDTLKEYENPYKKMIRSYDTQVDELIAYYHEVWRKDG